MMSQIKNGSSVIVAPSILSANLNNIEKEVQKVQEAGADWIHVDVMDGHFVPNLTFGIPIVKHLKQVTSLPLDVHLMIQNPEKHIEGFIRAGASSITVHEEVIHDQSILKKIKKSNVYSGLAIKPKTSVKNVFPYLEDLDYVMIMTVEPGLSGQKLIKDAAAKVQQLRQELDQRGCDIPIQVDGGVSDETLSYLVGAQIFVSGHYIFKSSDYNSAISQLKSNAQRQVRG